MSYHKRVKWKIEYYIDELGEKPIEDFLINLDKEQQGKVWQVIEQLETYGPNLDYPFTSQVEGRLRELRIQAGKTKIRILYYGDVKRSFILLHGFIKKNPKVSDSDKKKGLKRMRRDLELKELKK
jgi:phage-related protein